MSAIRTTTELHPTEHWDAIVIGGGTARLSAALMLGRSRRRVLVVDAGEPRNRFASHMHGILGNDGTDPTELLRRGREELAQYEVTIRPGTVTGIYDDEVNLHLDFADETSASTRALVLATGMTDGLPDIPGIRDFWGMSVLHCPYCHGWEVRGQKLAILGTSEMSLHQAQLVRQWSDQVVFFTAGVDGLTPEVAERLRSRGVELVDTPVAEVLSAGGKLSGVRLTDGQTIELDAIFVASEARPHDDLLAHFELERTTNPMGSFLATDMTGKTSHPRIWAAGNVSNPGATVPVSMSAGSMAGGMVNMALVTEEFDHAVNRFDADPDASAALAVLAADTPAASTASDVSSADTETPAEYWEGEYSNGGPRWSGSVNATTAAVAQDLPAGSVLELGCGEGGDAVWLAEEGWQVTAVDISPTATARGAEAAATRGVAEHIDWVASDLSTWTTDQRYDLVTASFFHSNVELERIEILRRAADLLRPGGHLLLVSHVFETMDDIPPWAQQPAQGHQHGHGSDDTTEHQQSHGHGGGHEHGHSNGDARGHTHSHSEDAGPDHHPGLDLPTPAEDLAKLSLDPEQWEVILEETRPRELASPDGTHKAFVKDGVLLIRRRA